MTLVASRLLILSALLLLAACERPTPPPATAPPSAPLSLAESSKDTSPAPAPTEEETPAAPSTTTASSEPTNTAFPSPQSPEPSTLASRSFPSGLPPHNSPISPEQAHALLTGQIHFNPTAIPGSDIPIAPDTPLAVGQDLQVKWGNDWWAGTVLSFEPDGRIRIHYFGWADSWDEPKTRTELQLDRQARVHALDRTYVRQSR